MYRYFHRLLLSATLLASVTTSSMSYAIENAASTAGSATVVSENKCDMSSMLNQFEGGKSAGDYFSDNNKGFIGTKNWGSKALEQMGYLKPGSGQADRSTYNPASWTGKDGIWNADDFKNNKAVQDSLGMAYSDQQMKEISSSIKGMIGSDTPLANPSGGGSSSCGALTETGLRMGMHLVGSGGFTDFMKSGGFCGEAGETAPNGYTLKNNTKDNRGKGTCASKYACAGNNCSVITTDMNKKTCSVVMPMIEAISCSNFTGQSRSLCNQAKPYLMTRAECADAEKMSEAAQKGPNAETCKNSTFGPGTGSWSYVLACSWASTAVADQDGAANPSGPVTDPACMEKLKGMGVAFDIQGTVGNGQYGGTTCSIQNAVALRGTAVPFGARLTMTCDMAIAMEQFGQKAKALGVTGYYDIGSTRPCGPMRDKGGNKPGTITNHALGQAVDISGVIVGGRKISMGTLLNPSTPDGALTSQLKALACSTFRGVLSPTYAGYIGAYVHFHVEWGKASNMCR